MFYLMRGNYSLTIIDNDIINVLKGNDDGIPTKQLKEFAVYV